MILKMNNQTSLSKLELLRRERENLEVLCKEKEQKLVNDFHYLSDNAGDIIVNSIYTAAQIKIATIFASSESNQASETNENISSFNVSNLSGFAFDLIKQNFTPKIVFKLIQPIITAFLIKQVKKLFKH